MARKWLAAVVLLGLGAVAFWLWNDDARRIERRYGKLQKLAGKSLAETQLEGAGRARAMADLFAAEFELIAEPENYATSNRQDLIRAVMSYRSRARTLAVDVLRQELFVDAGGASAILYAHVRFVADFGDLAGSDIYPVRVEWVEEGRDWKVKKLEILQPDRDLPLR